MIFVTGPLYAGKQEAVCRMLGWTEETFQERGIRDVQRLAAETDDLQTLAEQLAQYDVVIATEVGGGVVPADAGLRHSREAAGRLACLLAARADTVVRICCGLPQILKGELPCSSR